MAVQHSYEEYGREDVDDLVRSLALSSAKLWGELFERLRRLEVAQDELRVLVTDVRTALSALPVARAAATRSAVALSVPSLVPGAVAETVRTPAAPTGSAGATEPPPPPPGCRITAPPDAALAVVPPPPPGYVLVTRAAPSPAATEGGPGAADGPGMAAGPGMADGPGAGDGPGLSMPLHATQPGWGPSGVRVIAAAKAPARARSPRPERPERSDDAGSDAPPTVGPVIAPDFLSRSARRRR